MGTTFSDVRMALRKRTVNIIVGDNLGSTKHKARLLSTCYKVSSRNEKTNLCKWAATGNTDYVFKSIEKLQGGELIAARLRERVERCATTTVEMKSRQKECICPGIGKDKISGHMCDANCARWWLGNGGQQMLVDELCSEDLSLLKDMCSICMIYKEFQSKLHVCGCHLPWTQYDETGKPLSDASCPMRPADIAALPRRESILEAAAKTRSGILPGDATIAAARVAEEGSTRICATDARLAATEKQLRELEIKNAKLLEKVKFLEDAAMNQQILAAKISDDKAIADRRVRSMEAALAEVNIAAECERRALEAEIVDLKAVARESASRSARIWAKLRSAYIAEQSLREPGERAGWSLSMAEAVCNRAGLPGEYTRLAAAAATSRERPYALFPRVESSEQHKLRKAKERRVSALWFLMLEGQSERIHFLQAANAKLLHTTEIGQRVAGAQGLALPKRSADRQKHEDRKHHDERINRTIVDLLRPTTGVQHVVTLWDDDYYR